MVRGTPDALLLHVLLLQWPMTNWASLAPPCRFFDSTIFSNGSKPALYSYYKCSGLESSADFRRRVESALHAPGLWLVVKDSSLDVFHPSSFARGDVSILEVDNVTATTLPTPDAKVHRFPGLEGSLRRLVYRRNSTLPTHWGVLARLLVLEELEFYDMGSMALGADFNELPKSVTTIQVRDCSIDFVDSLWLSTLSNLETVIVTNSNLKTIARTMFPRPARRLKTMDFWRNSLTVLPADIGEECPALRFINVAHNMLTSIDEVTMSSLRNQRTYVYAAGNPLHCDCALAFLSRFPEVASSSRCATPEPLKGRYLSDLPRNLLGCVEQHNVSVRGPGP
ncbi:leucine-rich repeat and immunoglobulin-like domain-containing nogo receptor-interacting protein 4 [Ixodes scapularis]